MISLTKLSISLLFLLLFLTILPAAQASNPGAVNSRGTAVCWKTNDYRYAKELVRGQNLWNRVTKAPRILHENQGCVPNFIVTVDYGPPGDIQGTTYDGANGYMGEIILYKKEIDQWPRCRKWVAAHELGHALGLPHLTKGRTLMNGTCQMKTDAPTNKDVQLYRKTWANWPRSIETDEELRASQGP